MKQRLLGALCLVPIASFVGYNIYDLFRILGLRQILNTAGLLAGLMLCSALAMLGVYLLTERNH